jgi:hypothetical protein
MLTRQPVARHVLSLDIESPIYAVCAVIFSRTISLLSDSPFFQTLSLLLAFVPVLLLSYKIVTFLEKKNIFLSSSRSARLAILGLLVVPLVYIPITLLSYLIDFYVLATLILVICLTGLGEKLALSKRLKDTAMTFIRGSFEGRHVYFFLIQILVLAIVGSTLNSAGTWTTPADFDYVRIALLSTATLITAYLLASNSKFRHVSTIITATFLFSLLSIQGVVNYGGDSGLFVSTTKQLLDGNSADFISPEDRWRFGSLAFLGYPSLTAYLSQTSMVSPEYSISFANALAIVYITLGGLVLSGLFGKNYLERNMIFGVYLIALPSTYYFIANNFRSVSFLLLVLPLVIPIFQHLRFNNSGKAAYLTSMLSIVVIHPLSFVFIPVMSAALFKHLKLPGRIIFAAMIAIFAAIVLVGSSSLLRVLSISPEELPSFFVSFDAFDVFQEPFASFLSVDWPAKFTFMIALSATILLTILVLFKKIDNVPRGPLIGLLVTFFALAILVHTENFPIIRLSIVFGSLGIALATCLLVRHLNHKTFRTIPLIMRSAVPMIVLGCVVIIVVTNAYPWGRALALDSISLDEYHLLKAFISKERPNLQTSIIFAHIETMRYLNGIDGSLLYYVGSKPFSFDFTDPPTASRFYDAFAKSVKGDLSGVFKLSLEKEARSVYVVELYRFFPESRDQIDSNIIVANNAGLVRKIEFDKVQPTGWSLEKKGVEHADVSTSLNGITSIMATFSKNYTAALSTVMFDKPAKGVIVDLTYSDRMTPRFFLLSENDSYVEVKHDPINGTNVLVSGSAQPNYSIHGLRVSLDSGRLDQFGQPNDYPTTAMIHINNIYLMR